MPHGALQAMTTVSPGATLVTPVSNGLDVAGGLVSEQEGEVVADPAFAVVQVGVADAAGLDPNQHLVRSGSGTRMVTTSTGAPRRRAITP